MIVVDVNVLAYLLIPGRYTESAEQLLLADPQWAAPRLWRSELRNVLATYVRSGALELADAVALFHRASLILETEEYEVDTADVLRLSRASGCSAYDCEYVALAEFLDLKLMTADAKLVKAFPHRASALSGS
ncbi:MAG TPA: type II toxin-antitoxin system VapC family toxin [Burkholderiaceae bacterium]|nr:type II toxin-antitoxin system VapC family toxin [Burkholderiaceae bacterium]